MPTNGSPFTNAIYKNRKTIPYVTFGLIAICSSVFLYEISLAGIGFSTTPPDLIKFFYRWGFIPSHLNTNVFSGYQPLQNHAIVSSTFPPTAITMFSSMFVHAGWMHFSGNILFLWVLGDNVEDRLGHLKFLAFYLLTGSAGTLLHSVFDLESAIPLIGASGAIYGIAGAYVVMFTRNLVPIIIWFIFPNIQGLGFSDSINGNISYLAHTGGFAFGVVATISYQVATGGHLFFGRPKS